MITLDDSDAMQGGYSEGDTNQGPDTFDMSEGAVDPSYHPTFPDPMGYREPHTATRSLRRRTNVKTSVAGVKTFDVTVDSTGYSLGDHLAELDLLTVAMEARCAPPT